MCCCFSYIRGLFFFLIKCSAECVSSEKEYQEKNLQENKESCWVKRSYSVFYFHNPMCSLKSLLMFLRKSFEVKGGRQFFFSLV